jgi:hypothetical protein
MVLGCCWHDSDHNSLKAEVHVEIAKIDVVQALDHEIDEILFVVSEVSACALGSVELSDRRRLFAVDSLVLVHDLIVRFVVSK